MSADITAILEDLAAGRIDAAEANRRIAAAGQEQPPSGSTSGPGEGAGPRRGASEEETSGADKGPLGGFTIPPEAKEGLRSAWRVVSGVAGSVGETVASTMSPGPRRASGQSEPDKTVDAASDLDRVRLTCTGRRIRVIADRAISGLQIEGKHTRRRIGRVVEVSIDGHIAPDLGVLKRFRLPADMDGIKDLGLGREVTVRVHPDLPLDIELSGGSLHTTGVAHLGRVRVTAGVAQIDGVHQLEDGLFQAGNGTITGCIDTGRSQIRVESGNVLVKLLGGSNVAVRGKAQTGMISWPEGGDVDEYVMGNGAARLDLTCLVGRIAVRAM
ncbi:hypothetical protein O6R08_02490 [Cutibacterium equinum]|uniref:Adhesin domain-containing protein n=1 Tax=Cutibacterium equinum TaxID=3016342 RepID=A0ABY7QZD6_9ACTN|nr:hypothetical protein [Cutibacterium equinum]WCC80411.1 hypothetical protein O6R08_02490 [Cutibacterium equinum]